MRKLIFAASLLLAAAPSFAAHPVFDLVANRTLAHQQRQGGLLIAAGAPGFAKYVRFSRPLSTWKLRAVEDGKKVALAQAQATLEIPLTVAQARANSLTMRLKSPVRGTVRARSGAAMALAVGWQTVNVPITGLLEGENKIVLTFAEKGMIGGQKASAAVEWIQVGGSAAPDAVPALSDGKSLSLAKGDGAAWYVQVPQEGALATGGCALHVEAKWHGGHRSRPIRGRRRRGGSGQAGRTGGAAGADRRRATAS